MMSWGDATGVQGSHRQEGAVRVLGCQLYKGRVEAAARYTPRHKEVHYCEPVSADGLREGLPAADMQEVAWRRSLIPVRQPSVGAGCNTVVQRHLQTTMHQEGCSAHSRVAHATPLRGHDALIGRKRDRTSLRSCCRRHIHRHTTKNHDIRCCCCGYPLGRPRTDIRNADIRSEEAHVPAWLPG